MLNITDEIKLIIKKDNRFRQSGFYAMGYKNYEISYDELLKTPFNNEQFKNIKIRTFNNYLN